MHASVREYVEVLRIRIGMQVAAREQDRVAVGEDLDPVARHVAQLVVAVLATRDRLAVGPLVLRASGDLHLQHGPLELDRDSGEAGTVAGDDASTDVFAQIAWKHELDIPAAGRDVRGVDTRERARVDRGERIGTIAHAGDRERAVRGARLVVPEA
ncbi:MAG: hypothetical protein IPJ19_20980 [Planctomycetes bacterium]|nr:hypothetical protein [Planctomycetota bacterium]